MMIQAALNYNLDVSVMDPSPDAPCAQWASSFTVGDLGDVDKVWNWGKDLDLITIEIEHVNVEALKRLQDHGVIVYPRPAVIELIQDKRRQKTFYKANGIPTADFVLTERAAEVAEKKEWLPAVHKLGREGYDGRGVQVLREASDLPLAFDQPGVLEEMIDFEAELSVIVARNADGETRCFPVVQMEYHPEQNLVEFLYAPAEVSSEIEEAAYDLATDVINKLDMVGLLAVEMFLTRDGRLLVNEIAPRTHNSGHHTIEANITSQFEQHLRAILNWPLGATDLRSPAAMVNILGAVGHTGEAKYDGLERILKEKAVYIHLYGKKMTRPFRKMGHITLLDESIEALKGRAKKIKEILKVVA